MVSQIFRVLNATEMIIIVFIFQSINCINNFLQYHGLVRWWPHQILGFQDLYKEPGYTNSLFLSA